MRHLRAKQGRKTLHYFRISFGIAPPYTVLLDGNFIHTCTKHKIDINARMSKHLGGEKFKFVVPRCVLKELSALGAAVEDALEFAQANCEPIDGPPSTARAAGAEGGAGAGQTPTEAIRGLIGSTNPLKLIVCTQEDELRAELRRLGGVPLLHVQRTVLLLEGPSSASRRQSDRAEQAKLKPHGAGRVDTAETEAVALARKIRMEERAEKRRADGAASDFAPKKQKAKGPNPLSCMKKKKPEAQSGGAEEPSKEEGGGRKRARRSKKKPQKAEKL
mmetsp:Transcript_11805/g.27649  ORF Transcript_11805/g.27649 Transcript_11805/m.27649 type:complete len:275 (-) Transcript_11805:237-1061(-)